MNARIQTWFPFHIQICLNGREWLGRQLHAAGRADFRRLDNCFTWLGDPKFAQRLTDRQLAIDWPRALSAIAHRLNPLHSEIFKPWPQAYYWSAYQTEWATDILFREPRTLAAIYPSLSRHAMTHFRSADVMRFLARKAPGKFEGELVASFKDRAEGVRVKHWCNGNSIKMYDQGASIVRIETKIGNPLDFKVLRPLNHRPHSKLAWRPMRSASPISTAALKYPNAPTTRISTVCRRSRTPPRRRNSSTKSPDPTTYRRRRVRALRSGHPDDIALLDVISSGELAVGFAYSAPMASSTRFPRATAIASLPKATCSPPPSSPRDEPTSSSCSPRRRRIRALHDDSGK